MKRFGFNTIFAAVLLAIFAAVLLWQNPGLLGGRLAKDEIARYLVQIERRLPMPPDEKPAEKSLERSGAAAGALAAFEQIAPPRLNESVVPVVSHRLPS